MEGDFIKQKRRIEEQQRLIDSLCCTKKVVNPSLPTGIDNYDAMMGQASEEAQKNERIAQGTSRSTFLNLGEKKTKLVICSRLFDVIT